jgi:hypothetical protein
MGHLSRQQLASIALGLDGHAADPAHLRQCDRCRSKLESLRSLIDRLGAAHGRFDRGHDEARERLLAVLPERQTRISSANAWDLIYSWIGALTMRQRLALGGAGGLIVLALWLFSAGMMSRPLYAMAQVADSIRKARSYEFTMTMEMDLPREAGKPAAKGTMGGRFYWAAPGSYRIENRARFGPTEQDQVSIFPAGKPGIDLDRTAKRYTRRAAQQGQKSQLMTVEKLGNYSGQADADLGTKQIDGRAARGFQIRGSKIDPDMPAGTLLDVWVSPQSNLPVLVSIAMRDAIPHLTVRLTDFRWNVDLDPKLFDTTPPAGFAEIAQDAPPRDLQVRRISEGLKLFAKYSGGHYPRVRMLYGDATRDELVKLSKAPYPGRTPEDFRDPRVKEIQDATWGFATINTILRENPDAAYQGRTVGPADKDKVLLRWKLDDGNYQVIYGDLRSEVVTATRLKQLESR